MEIFPKVIVQNPSSDTTIQLTNPPTFTPTITPTVPPIGPEITIFGVARADGTITSPVGTDMQGRPIYERPVPQGFLLFLEVRPGPGGRAPGTVTFREFGAPDLQIATANNVGNGSSDVCDDGSSPSFIGGVPASPPTFTNINAINDLTCRFEHRSSGTACTFNGADFGFVLPLQSTAQFCTAVGVGAEYAFPPGSTVLTARVLDNIGQPGVPASIVIDVE